MQLELEAILQSLCRALPSAIGAILCDFEGEAVVCALGSAPVPPEAEARALDHVPRAMQLTMPVPEFLIRLAGAEPAALLRLFGEQGERFGTGGLDQLHMSYAEVEMLVRRLPNEYYLALLLRRPAVSSTAKRHLDEASRLLREHVS